MAAVWAECGRFLQETPEESLNRAAVDESIMARAECLYEAMEESLARPAREDGVATIERPVAFFCAESASIARCPCIREGSAFWPETS